MTLPALLISAVLAAGHHWPSPWTAPISHRPRASLRSRVSKTQLARGGTEAACHFHGVVADKQCTCLASKLMWEHYPPTPPFYCGENEIQASLISSASVGATPTPATNITKGSDPARGL